MSIVYSIADMRAFLDKSLSSVNLNKINGLMAEIDFRNYLHSSGFADRISVGGWILRNVRGDFSHNVVAVFPEIVVPDQLLSESVEDRTIPHKLHTICATFHQIGIRSYYAVAIAEKDALLGTAAWRFKRLGVPQDTSFVMLEEMMSGFVKRDRIYNPLRYKSDSSLIQNQYVAEEFSKENLRVAIQNKYFSEMSDIDGILWGEQFTYPIEIKEKTRAEDPNIGEYFGLDLGPFVKLAFYAAKKGNLHSLFVVREIDDRDTRNLVGWKAITFDRLAQYASWVPMGGGQNMRGGGSTVVKIPVAEFSDLSSDFLKNL